MACLSFLLVPILSCMFVVRNLLRLVLMDVVLLRPWNWSSFVVFDRVFDFFTVVLVCFVVCLLLIGVVLVCFF